MAGREEHAARINEAWQKGVDAVIETGMRIIDAREALEHGEYIAMVKDDLLVSRQTAHKLVSIASNKVLSNVAHVRHLPPSWGTLSELAVVANKGFDLEAGIASGAIHPKMERKDVKALLSPPPQRDDDLEGPDEEDDLRPEETTNPLAVAWENASGEERASFLHGLGREVLLEALAVIDAADKRTAVQRAADRAEARSAAAIEPKGRGRPPGSKSKPKRRGRPPGSKNKHKTIDETTEVADDLSNTLIAQMRQRVSTGAPEEPIESAP
jgi:hypothetical protein